MVVMEFMDSQSDPFQVVPGMRPLRILPTLLDGRHSGQDNGAQYQPYDLRSRGSTVGSICGCLRIGTVLIVPRITVLDRKHKKNDQADQRNQTDE